MNKMAFGHSVLFSVISLFFSTATLAHQTDDTGLFSNSGIRGPSYREIESELKSLAASYPDIAVFESYGETISGRSLNVIKIGYQDISAPMPREGYPAVVLTGATHGNEFLHIEDRLPRWILENHKTLSGLKSFFEKGGLLYIVPIFNPDGYSTRIRENARGVDLNRDFDLEIDRFKGFKETETKAFVDYLEHDLAVSKHALKVTMDYHCCAGAWLYPWSYTSKPLDEVSLKRHQDLATAMIAVLGANYKHGTTGSLLGYTPRGTSKDYYFSKFGALSFTFEGVYKVEAEKLNEHGKIWELILSLL